jgi:hypothetical protein
MIKWIKNFVYMGLNGSTLIEGYQRAMDNLGELYSQQKIINEELQRKYEESKAELQRQIDKDNIEVSELKEWYEGRRLQSSWTYNGGRLGLSDVKNYLKPRDTEPFVLLAKEIIEKYGLDKSMSPTQIIEGVYRYWNLKASWTYKTDLELYGRQEWWEDPTDALNNRKGDCESKAHCMYNTAKQTFILLGKTSDFWRLTFVASMVLGEGGHGYLTWLASDGEYYVVESTYDQVNSHWKTWLRTPIRYNNLYYDFWGYATDTKSWSGTYSALTGFKDIKG